MKYRCSQKQIEWSILGSTGAVRHIYSIATKTIVEEDVNLVLETRYKTGSAIFMERTWKLATRRRSLAKILWRICQVKCCRILMPKQIHTEVFRIPQGQLGRDSGVAKSSFNTLGSTTSPTWLNWSERMSHRVRIALKKNLSIHFLRTWIYILEGMRTLRNKFGKRKSSDRWIRSSRYGDVSDLQIRFCLPNYKTPRRVITDNVINYSFLPATIICGKTISFWLTGDQRIFRGSKMQPRTSQNGACSINSDAPKHMNNFDRGHEKGIGTKISLWPKYVKFDTQN